MRTDEYKAAQFGRQAAAQGGYGAEGEGKAVDWTSGITYGGGVGPGAQSLADAAAQRSDAALGRRNDIDYANGTRLSLGRAALLNDQAMATRGQQVGALGMLQSQAAGTGPSAAGINAGLAQSNATQAALQGLGAGRSSLANAAMTRQTLGANAQAQLGVAGQAGANRAQEMMQARQAFGNAGAGLSAADYGSANAMGNIAQTQLGMGNAQAQQQLNQTAANIAYAQDQERQRYNIGQTLLKGQEAAQQRAMYNRKQDLGAFQAGIDRDNNLWGAYFSTLGSATAGGASALSDERAKTPAGQWDVLPLYNPEGLQLRQSEGGRGYYDVEAPTQETIGGGMARPSLASAAMAQHAATAPKSAEQAPQKRRELTPEEMMALADKEIASINATADRSLAQGAAVHAPDDGVMADANRKMAGESYQYRPEYTPPDEIPGQIHHGFMAQNLEQNPVTATAVEVGPDGMRQVHGHRMLQAVASGLSDLQRQMDETRLAMKGKR